VAEHIQAHGHEIVAWNRSQVATDDPQIVRDFIRSTRPDWFLHIATGSPDWTEWAAQVCAEDQIKFLFTSSVSVFSDQQHGPFGVDVQPAAADDYGAYKIACEQRVQHANPQAIIARLAWQIGTAPGSNNMIDFLHRTVQANGQIEASTHWYPACAFLEDTAGGVYRLIDTYEPGMYHLDGNPGLTFHQIVTSLNRLHGELWTIVPTATPVQNNRMLDDRISIKPITAHFGS
jgi:dTDP-4-dehydrorhamnose reductase